MNHSLEIKEGCLSEKRTTQILMIHLPFGGSFQCCCWSNCSNGRGNTISAVFVLPTRKCHKIILNNVKRAKVFPTTAKIFLTGAKVFPTVGIETLPMMFHQDELKGQRVPARDGI